MDLTYLQLLAEQYPTVQATSTKIIELEATLELPKETEHFLSDIHGEYEAFLHLLRNSSGSLRRRIDELFGTELSGKGRRSLATLVYYPEQKLPLILAEETDESEWYRITFRRLIRLCRSVSTKYTRATVRQSLPPDYATIIEELLYSSEQVQDRAAYYDRHIESMIQVGQAKTFLIALTHLIQRLTISHLHILGDIYDRGPGAHIILDELMNYHSLDIQWGNHDILWMGAAAGSEACIANVIRISLRYTNTETLENGYGISLLPLASFAMERYGEDLCTQFMPKLSDDLVRLTKVDDYEQQLLARMQKAITIIQLKLEGQIIQRRSHYQMADRLLLDKINHQRGVLTIDGQDFELIDTFFPTINPDAPYELTDRERLLMNRLKQSFRDSGKLQAHVRFLYAKGSMYIVYNGNLLYHGCIALNEDGTFVELQLKDLNVSGKAYFDRVERLARQGYFAVDPDKRQYGQDAMWYLWSGARSPLYGKNKMATFERYFVNDKKTHVETQNPYYRLRDETQVIDRILVEFGLNPATARIINGHVPVRVRQGQSPIKAAGRLLVIDGGLAKAYQQQTGIAGYTLISNSRGLLLAEHKPFESAQKAIQDEVDLDSRTEIIATYPRRMRVEDTDKGQEIKGRIEALQALLNAYRTGLIKESN
ncbi:MAG: fructose 1,6-bisphosphatase [Anaerolineae bacterium SG8_19]|jgi:fructose-1,6-bisphosphatase-3|nr:MAG: fructose 1,6-bisphosphatase [Anaerolineae bacterium SG8_19]